MRTCADGRWFARSLASGAGGARATLISGGSAEHRAPCGRRCLEGVTRTREPLSRTHPNTRRCRWSRTGTTRGGSTFSCLKEVSATTRSRVATALFPEATRLLPPFSPFWRLTHGLLPLPLQARCRSTSQRSTPERKRSPQRREAGAPPPAGQRWRQPPPHQQNMHAPPHVSAAPPGASPEPKPHT